MKDKKFNIKEPSELLNIIKNKITKTDIFIVILVFILGLLNNFTFFTGKGIAPDALSTGDFNIAGRWEISLGRFGLYFANLMRFGLVNKFLIIIFSLAFLSLATIVITRIFEIKSKILTFIIAAIISVAPQFTETYFFIYCADAYCFAFLIAALTVWFLKNSENHKMHYVFAAICTIIVCSIYQAYLGVILGLTIILLINDLLNNEKLKDVIIKALKYIGIIFVGVIVYYVILKVIIHALGISLADYKGANGFGLDTIMALPKTIMQTYIDFFNFFFTNEIIINSYWKRRYINVILFAIFGIRFDKYNY